MSPLPLAPIPPTHARPTVARRASRWHWIGSERRVGGKDHDDRTRRRGHVAMRRHDVRADLPADRHAIDAQQVARAVVRLHQRADGPRLAAPLAATRDAVPMPPLNS